MTVRPPKEDAKMLSVRGLACLRAGRTAEAVALLRQAAALAPEGKDVCRNLALALRQAGDVKAAGVAAETGLRHFPDDDLLHGILAESLRRQKRTGQALRHAERAVALKPDNPDARANLAMIHADGGDSVRAAAAAEKAIELNPLCAQAHRTLAHARTYTDPDDDHIRRMTEALSTGNLLPKAKADLNFALGKACDDLRDYGRAFAFYQEGNRLIRSTFKFSMEAVSANFRQFRAAADAETKISRSSTEDAGTPVPVFIVGMPRSGTSLVEQILASHPFVFGAGELDALADIQFRSLGMRPSRYLERFQNLTAGDLDAIALSYREALEQNAPPGMRGITDKMPLNFRFIPLILRLFPRAKIIHCRRDPRDTCLSIFRTGFSGHIPFANDLNETAAYYREYDALMTFFTEKYGSLILTLPYEDLVADLEGQTRRMLTHCGLAWDDSCRDFHKHDRAVVTASNYQVRRPVYKTSVGSWKKYEAFLPGGYPFP